MFFLTLLLSSILAGTDTLTVKDTTPPVKTIDLTGTVIVNADYANQPVLSINKSDVSAVDTLDTADEFVKILLYGDRTWRYIKVGGDRQKPEVFQTHWETTSVNPYQKPVDQLPDAWSIWLVDSLSQFHCPYKGAIWPGGKYGPRTSRRHQGVDLPLAVGAPIYATFPGKVRVSRYSENGYGHYIVIRHENGLETFYAHLSERKVAVGDWVNAGDVIGLGGSSGRSTGPHLHFETRYKGFAFDPQWLIDFEKGTLRKRLFVLKKRFFNIYSNYEQDFEDEFKNAEEDKKEDAEREAMRWYTIKSGDTLGRIAINHNTTVSELCRLNGMTRTTTLKIGRKIRVR